jgi:inner membrane protein involved in colicin E2 resistance
MTIQSRFHPTLVKFALVALITALLLIPLNLVQGLIGERSGLRARAVDHVAASVGHAQQIGAVMLSVPVTRTWEVDGKAQSKPCKNICWRAAKGVGVVLPPLGAASAGSSDDALEFAFDLEIAGTESLRFLPFAESTQATLRSSWPDPSMLAAIMVATRKVDWYRLGRE